jgi:hypothetical protein
MGRMMTAKRRYANTPTFLPLATIIMSSASLSASSIEWVVRRMVEDALLQQ